DRKPLTKKQFIKVGDDICRQGNDLLQQLQQQYFGNLGPNEQPDAATVDEFAQNAVPVLRQEYDGIKALAPPAADKGKIKKLLAAFKKGIDTIESNPSSIAKDPLTKAEKLAKQYGFKVCGS